MRNYKSSQEKATPMNTCAPSELIDEFLLAATDLEMGDTLSRAIQISMRYVINKKDDKKFKEEINELT